MENTITSKVSEIVRIKRKDLCSFFDCFQNLTSDIKRLQGQLRQK